MGKSNTKKLNTPRIDTFFKPSKDKSSAAAVPSLSSSFIAVQQSPSSSIATDQLKPSLSSSSIAVQQSPSIATGQSRRRIGSISAHTTPSKKSRLTYLEPESELEEFDRNNRDRSDMFDRSDIDYSDMTDCSDIDYSDMSDCSDVEESFVDDWLKEDQEAAALEEQASQLQSTEPAPTEEQVSLSQSVKLASSIANWDFMMPKEVPVTATIEMPAACFNYVIELFNRRRSQQEDGQLQYNGRSTNSDGSFGRVVSHMFRVYRLNRNPEYKCQKVHTDILEFLRKDPDNAFKIVVVARDQTFEEMLNFEQSLIELNRKHTPKNSNVANGWFATGDKCKRYEDALQIAVQKCKEDTQEGCTLSDLEDEKFYGKFLALHFQRQEKKICSEDGCEARFYSLFCNKCSKHRPKKRCKALRKNGTVCDNVSGDSNRCSHCYRKRYLGRLNEDWTWNHNFDPSNPKNPSKRCKALRKNGTVCDSASGTKNHCGSCYYKHHLGQLNEDWSWNHSFDPKKPKNPSKRCIGLRKNGTVCGNVSYDKNHCGHCYKKRKAGQLNQDWTWNHGFDPKKSKNPSKRCKALRKNGTACDSASGADNHCTNCRNKRKVGQLNDDWSWNHSFDPKKSKVQPRRCIGLRKDGTVCNNLSYDKDHCGHCYKKRKAGQLNQDWTWKT